MIVEAIVSQTIRDGQKPVQQISDLLLTGLSSKASTSNSDSGRLYGSFVKDGDNYILTLYKDMTRLDAVASATSTTLGSVDVTEQNDSGITGSVNLIQYVADDEAIEVICFLSMDSDLPMANLETMSAYDADLGFIDLHLKSFAYLKQFIISRFKSKIWNPDWVSIKNLHGNTGGYDLSRVLNWDGEDLKQASAHYAFSLLAEQNYVEPGSTFDIRAKESRNRVKAHLTGAEIRIDENHDRIEDDNRSFSTWKF